MEVMTPGRLVRYTPNERGVDIVFENGRLRLTAPFEGAVRVRFTPGERFAPRRSWDVVAPDEELKPVPFQLEEDSDQIVLSMPPVRVLVSRQDGQTRFLTPSGEEFAADIAPIHWSQSDLRDASDDMAAEQDELVKGLDEHDESLRQRSMTEVRARKAAPPEEIYYGFGQRIGLLDRRGRKLANWTIDPEMGHSRGHDNLYQAHPTFLALRPGLAWGCFLHSTWYSQFDVGADDWNTLAFRTFGGELDYYVFFGPTPAGVIEKLTRLTGRPFLPPLWALGYHQSRWGYMNQEEIREIAREFDERQIPLDVIHFDIDYMHGYRDFTWDPERFPDPKGLIAELKERGLRAVAIIDPGVKHDLGGGYKIADEGITQNMFIKNADETPFVGYCWPDAALFPDFAREDVRRWWGQLHKGHIEAGVDGIWNDMNEPAIFDRPFSEGFSKQKPMSLGTPQGAAEEQTVHAETHNLYGLQMGQATYKGLSKLRPNHRPWILSRSGYTGLQRYAAAWMGDNNSWWEHLEASLPQLTSMGLSGVPHVGVDVGGFFGNSSAELYTRWIQLGTFYPFMRTHTAAGTNRQEPWSFGPEVEEIARQYIRLRYRLLPYLYTLAHHAHSTGAPILRPMMYDFPDEPTVYHLHDQVMFGPQLLVAPIYHPGRTHRIVYLPNGRWYDFWTGKAVDGGQALAAHAPIDRIPVFVRGGAILTLGNERNSTAEPITELTLALYPDGESEWSLLEDDGETLAYQQGQVAETAITMAQTQSRLNISVGPRRGAFEPHSRTVGIRAHLEQRPEVVVQDGEEQSDWTWNEEQQALELRWEDDGQAHEVEVRQRA